MGGQSRKQVIQKSGPQQMKSNFDHKKVMEFSGSPKLKGRQSETHLDFLIVLLIFNTHVYFLEVYSNFEIVEFVVRI